MNFKQQRIVDTLIRLQNFHPMQADMSVRGSCIFHFKRFLRTVFRVTPQGKADRVGVKITELSG